MRSSSEGSMVLALAMPGGSKLVDVLSVDLIWINASQAASSQLLSPNQAIGHATTTTTPSSKQSGMRLSRIRPSALTSPYQDKRLPSYYQQRRRLIGHLHQHLQSHHQRQSLLTTCLRESILDLQIKMLVTLWEMRP